MQDLKIVKRNGDVVAFDPERIRRAVRAALDATATRLPDERVDRLDAAICEEVLARFVDFYPNVENVQDIVEKHLMREGLYDVAKAYILYRAERQQRRDEARREAVERARLGRLTVRCRDGRQALFNPRRLEEDLARSAQGLDGPLDLERLLQVAVGQLYDGIATERIEQLLVEAAAARMARHPVYGQLASRLLRQALLREVVGHRVRPEQVDAAYRESFLEGLSEGLDRARLDPRLAGFDRAGLVVALEPERDLELSYPALRRLVDDGLLRDGDRRVELPQAAWMRVAMGLALAEPPEARDARAIEFYHLLSRRRFLPAMACLRQAGRPGGRLASAYVAAMGTQPEQVFARLAQSLPLARGSAALGADWSALPASGTALEDARGESAGLVPLLKLASDAVALVGRGPWPRRGACASLAAWHLDFEDFLELHRAGGDERRRARDLPTVAWIPDLLMRRVMADETWTLFSPEEVPELLSLVGQAFEEAYRRAEQRALAGQLRQHRRLPARALWRRLVAQAQESGHPDLAFQDHCDLRSPRREGRVRSTTGGGEIVLSTRVDEMAVCYQGSLNLAAHVGADGGLDERRLRQTVRGAVRMLDNAVELGRLDHPSAERFARRHRAIGLGMMGLQDLLYRLDIPFGSREALGTVDAVTELVGHAAYLASSELAAERGACPGFAGSDWELGRLPIDGHERLARDRGQALERSGAARLDWAGLRETVQRQGMRNLWVLALGSSRRLATIAGVFPGLAPVERHRWTEPSSAGEQVVLNPYLVADLEQAGLWTDRVREALEASGGDLAAVDGIPQRLRSRHQQASEIDPIWCLRLAAASARWVDQGLSIPVHLPRGSAALLSEVLLSAWRLGLKTTGPLRLAPAGPGRRPGSAVELAESLSPGADEPGTLARPSPAADERPAPREPSAERRAEPLASGIPPGRRSAREDEPQA